ncbi:hypothetical protein M0804_011251 [Polistes exclamans]|nr:hypothetical protein M0804_011251 [Polistes exclamans]
MTTTTTTTTTTTMATITGWDGSYVLPPARLRERKATLTFSIYPGKIVCGNTTIKDPTSIYVHTNAVDTHTDDDDNDDNDDDDVCKRKPPSPQMPKKK